jgi:hypothetical protein
LGQFLARERGDRIPEHALLVSKREIHSIAVFL